MTGSGIDPAVRDRILDRRTRALATRGLRVDDDEPLGDHLVFRLGARLHALRPELVETIRLTAWHPVPLLRESAAAVVLGVFGHGGRLYSLLELARLLGDPVDEAAPGEGTMLLLRWSDRRIALRVDRVLGLLGLRRAGQDGGLGILDGDVRPAGSEPATGPEAEGRLVVLIDQARLRDSIAALDQPAVPAADPAPTGA